MNLRYDEIKEDVIDTYSSLHIRAEYEIKDTFYALLNDYEHSEEYTKTEECCIYVSFALLLIEKNKNIDFIKTRLNELLDNKKMEVHRIELKDEIAEFTSDVNKLKGFL
ncbi:hypothetical protein [Bacillus pseudomycoides]|uniref:hypothetical protein n=1 Tax=Bacillus pseudomycoides TaxID=64104 RepID=UPI000BEBAE18|nr:hypothetical protein [Bacillus pseudomycoides]MED4654609.1 hypothetical protein [Bacillus pseudomycoides]PEE02957.1 hypothetical protein CON86_28295 [Bacillus pseudomycoides]PEM66410.1 hypothetical protein CN632_27005 [Bacillus pseudomycoides]PHC77305.1 hypothetical protein COF63_29310 [Bacillus pseudomycoides]